MAEFLTMRRVKQLSFLMASFFLVIHITMYNIFWRYNVMPMAYFNIFSMTFYVIMLFVIYFEQLHIFVVATFIEISVHMGLAAHFVGWRSGFQITLIGICSLLYFAEYAGRTLHLKTPKSFLVAPLAMISYISAFIESNMRPAPYTLPTNIETLFHLSWAFIDFFVLMFILQIFVTVAARSQEALANEVLHDKLTGLPNRYYMSNFFGKMDGTTNERRFWTAIADIDDFKYVNDTYGHNCGDYVLVTLARLMREHTHEVELCRWGGEEFLLAGAYNGISPADQLEKLRNAVDKYHFQYEDITFHLTVTIGMAWFVPGKSIDEWIEAADKRLYIGKKGGKNRVVV